MRGRKPLDGRAVLLLGILIVQSQHGYRLNDFIERNLGRVTSMKKPTAYALLDRLCAEGLVTATDEAVAGRRGRRVYTITVEGERRFQQLLRAELSSPAPPAVSADVGVMFLDHLPRQEAIDRLTARLGVVEAQLHDLKRQPPHGIGVGVHLAAEQVVAHLRADRAFLESAIARLRAEDPGRGTEDRVVSPAF